MDKIEQAIESIPRTILAFINEQEEWTSMDNYFLQVQNDIEHFKKYGVFPTATGADLKPETNDNDKTNSLRQSQRTKKMVLNDHTQQNIHDIKLERISEAGLINNELTNENRDSLKENIKVEMPPPLLPVKKNKKTDKKSSVRSTRSTRTKGIKKEIQQISDDSSIGRDSDVVLQKEQLLIINLDDSEEEIQSKVKSKSNIAESDNDKSAGRITRSKQTKPQIKDTKEKGKRTRSSSSDTEKKTTIIRQTRQVKRIKSDETQNLVEEETCEQKGSPPQTPMIEENRTVQKIPKQILNETYVTKTATSRSSANNVLDQTTVLQKDVGNTTVTLEKPTLTNQTVIIDKPKLKHGAPITPMNLKDIMTDDEDDNVTVTITKKGITKGSKPIFSPFEGSPVKKRVEAFEKLGAEVASETPIRTTRTKTKALAKNKEKEYEMQAENQKSQTKSKRDTKLTPQMSNRLPGISYSAHKPMKTPANESLISTKSASALKSSQQEFKERELKRREKEAEAIRKREALLQTQADEKKKKREEKQVKAQQMREALERNKQKMLEQAEKTKEEKYKQAMAEKQEKIKRQQEESDRRRLEAMKKAAEEKRKEEENQKAAEEEEKRTQGKLKQEQLKKEMEEQKKMAKLLEHKKKAKGLPIYLRQKAPLLPTEDCYDSDHEEVETRRVKPPSWMSRDRMTQSLRSLQYTDNSVLNSFFVMNATTPDLRDIFENIDPKKLKRTSSAIWRAPPRFTLMPKTIEENGEDDY